VGTSSVSEGLAWLGFPNPVSVTATLGFKTQTLGLSLLCYRRARHDITIVGHLFIVNGVGFAFRVLFSYTLAD